MRDSASAIRVAARKLTDPLDAAPLTGQVGLQGNGQSMDWMLSVSLSKYQSWKASLIMRSSTAYVDHGSSSSVWQWIRHESTNIPAEIFTAESRASRNSCIYNMCKE